MLYWGRCLGAVGGLLGIILGLYAYSSATFNVLFIAAPAASNVGAVLVAASPVLSAVLMLAGAAALAWIYGINILSLAPILCCALGGLFLLAFGANSRVLRASASVPSTPSTGRRGSTGGWRVIAVLILVAVAWEFAAPLAGSPFLFPSLGQIWTALASGDWWSDITTTALSTVSGFGLGAIPAVLLHAFALRNNSFQELTAFAGRTLHVLTMTPAIIFLTILYVGIGEKMVITVCAIVSFSVSIRLLQDRPLVYKDIVLSLRPALEASFFWCLLTEILGGRRGLGYAMWSRLEIFDMAGLYAGMLVATAIAVLIRYGLAPRSTAT
jgi:NitT/TauT family transport system permease protein